MQSEWDTPLSNDELAELDQFLLSADDDEERLPIDEAHGYLTALVVSNALQDEWLEAVWGVPRFTNDEEAGHMTQLIQRMRQEIVDSLAHHRPFDPLVIEEEDEQGEVVEAYEGWCFGFMRAVADDQQCWEELSKSEQELLTPIAKLAMLCAEEEPQIDEDEYSDCVELLPGAVAGLYQHWHGD